MKITRERWKFKDEYYGPLLEFVKDENVTDINYNGKDVWIDDLTVGRYKADVVLSHDFLEHFSTRVADAVSENFNQYYPRLEAETDILRISILHEAVANTGRSISIRKTPVIKRLNQSKMLEEGYASEDILSLLQHCVEGKMNIVMCGLPGAGKTELLKWLTTFIPAKDRVITIEDSLEIHYAAINDGKDCVELKVDNDRFDYVEAIKACLRQNPQWILLSEARSTEVKHLLESMSTGTHCLTTLHTDDVRKVPDRVKNMIQDSVIAERVENDVYSFLDAAILVRKKEKNGKIVRGIEQMCFFSREKGENVCTLVIDEGRICNKEFPPEVMRKFRLQDISDPFAPVDFGVTDRLEVEPEDNKETTDYEDEVIADAYAKILLPEEVFDEGENDNEKNVFSFVTETHPA